MTEPRLFLLKDVATDYGLSPRGLADAARAGKIKTYKIQGRRYMSQAQIDEYLARSERGTVSEPSTGSAEKDEWQEYLKRRASRKAARRSDTR